VNIASLRVEVLKQGHLFAIVLFVYLTPDPSSILGMIYHYQIEMGSALFFHLVLLDAVLESFSPQPASQGPVIGFRFSKNSGPVGPHL
jgi:hypothetical protein